MFKTSDGLLLQVNRTILYQAALKPQDGVCTPCCEGKNLCGPGLQCLRAAGQVSSAGGVCVPSTATFNPGYCGPQISIINERIMCQTCSAPANLLGQSAGGNPGAQQSTGSPPISDQQAMGGNSMNSLQSSGSNQQSSQGSGGGDQQPSGGNSKTNLPINAPSPILG